MIPSSLAQSFLPQFSVLHMKHKISFLFSKPFLIEIWEIIEVRIKQYEVTSFRKEYIISQFYVFKILLCSWIEKERCQWDKGGEEWPCNFSDMARSTWMHPPAAKSLRLKYTWYSGLKKHFSPFSSFLTVSSVTFYWCQRAEQKSVSHLRQPVQRFYWMLMLSLTYMCTFTEPRGVFQSSPDVFKIN